MKNGTLGKWRPLAVHALAVALAVHTKRVKKAKKAKVRMVMYDAGKIL